MQQLNIPHLIGQQVGTAIAMGPWNPVSNNQSDVVAKKSMTQTALNQPYNQSLSRKIHVLGGSVHHYIQQPGFF
jgi:hypothetical protein